MTRRAGGINYSDVASVMGLAFSIVHGWNPIEAWSMGKKLITKFAKQEDWLDWVGENWERTYANDLKRAVKVSLLERSFVLPQVLEYDNTDTALPLTAFPITIDKEEPEYEVPERYAARNKDIVEYYENLQRTFRPGSRVELYDGICARLKEFDQSTHTFSFQKSSYFDYLRTNLAMDNKSAHISLRSELHEPSATLGKLKDSPLVNHLGINILVFTSGGEVVVAKRSLQVVVRPDELCSSASGAVGYGDIGHSAETSLTLANIPIFREVEEEMGWKVAKDIQDRATFLGLTRELFRGGKPELFFCANSTLRWEEIEAAFMSSQGKRTETVQIFPINFSPYHCERLPELDTPSRSGEFKHTFEIALKKIENTGKVSVPLLTNLALWFHYKMNGHV